LPRKLVVEVVGDASGLDRSLKSATGSSSRFGGSLAGVAAKVGIAGAAIAGGAIAIKGLIDKATEAEVVNRKMEAQLDALGISYDKHAGTIDRVIQKHSMLTGIDDEDLTEAFTKIVRVTGDVNEALRLNTIAADIARARNMDLGAAAELVGKVHAGKTGILAKYGIVLDKNATSTEALAALQQKFAGQAEASATVQEKLGVVWENLQEKLGAKLLPVFEKFGNWLVENMPQIEATVSKTFNTIVDAVTPFAQAFQDALPIIKPLFDFLGGTVLMTLENLMTPMVVIIKLLKGDWSGAWEAAKKPVENLWEYLSGIVNAIGPLIIGKFEAIYNAAKNLGAKILSGVKDGVADLVGWVRDKITDAIQAYVGLYARAFSAAVDFGAKILGGVKDGIGNLVAWVGGKIDDAIGAVGGKIGAMYSKAKEFGSALFDGIKDMTKGLGGFLVDVVRGGINAMIRAWNEFQIDFPGFSLFGFEIIPAFTINFPDIPYLAQGGIVTKPTLAMIGEAGPEAVIPLSGRNAMPSDAPRTPIIINVAGSVLTEQDLVAAVQRGIIEKGRRSGYNLMGGYA
jgi:hypothetical protein